MRLRDTLKSNKKLILLIPFFIGSVIIIELIMGIGMKNNSIWDRFNKWIVNFLD